MAVVTTAANGADVQYARNTDGSVAGLVDGSNTIRLPQIVAQDCGGVAGLLSVTGTTATQAIQICDLGALKLNAGDIVEVEVEWTYTASTNNKVLGLGVGATSASLASVGGTTRNSGTETFMATKQRLFITDTSNLTYPGSIVGSYGASTSGLSNRAVDLRGASAKLFATVALGLGSETAAINNYSVVVNRAP